MDAIAGGTEPATPFLRLNFHGRIIEHLGIQMYQAPTAAIAELISNSWDADAENVEVTIPVCRSPDASIVVKDDGDGMTLAECQHRFLRVGYNRRSSKASETSRTGRTILGRKGIGKFAGFGIARRVEIDTVSRSDGKRTRFQLDLDALNAEEYLTGAEVQVLCHEDAGTDLHGTTVTLHAISIKKWFAFPAFSEGLARRFLLRSMANNFQLSVNGQPVTDAPEPPDTQFRFPQEITEEEWEEKPPVVGGWAEEMVDGHSVRWQAFFTKEPLAATDLRGFSVFASGKLVQAPFFFNLTGGTEGQHGQQYLCGRVAADFLDAMNDDVISPERQRVKWDANESCGKLELWGQSLTKRLLKIWSERRSKVRMDELEQKMGLFRERLEKLQVSEQTTVKSALKKLAGVPTLDDTQFKELGSALFTAYESGRLRDLVSDISRRGPEISSDDFLRLLLEANVLAALNVAESIKVKLEAIKTLRSMVEGGSWENRIRDHLSEHPWILNPRWETFVKEKSLTSVLSEGAREAKLDEEEELSEADKATGRKRLDLALRSGNQLVVVEFMKPGKTLDQDHVGRIQTYISFIREKMEELTALGIDPHRVSGLVVADRLGGNYGMKSRLAGLKKDEVEALDWDMLLSRAEAEWQDFMSVLAARSPDDTRLKELKTDATVPKETQGS